MAEILERQIIVDSLKAGAEIRGTPVFGWRLGEKPKYARYDGKPGGDITGMPIVLGNILADLLKEGLIRQESMRGSQYYIYRWANRKFTCANIVFETKMGGLLYYCGKRRKEYPDNCNGCAKYGPMRIKVGGTH